jgi:murein DD-endopeptidase MepM/ murein hydrolase activator NlpD
MAELSRAVATRVVPLRVRFAHLVAAVAVAGSAVLAVSAGAPALAANVPQFLMLPFNASDKKIVIQRAWWTVDPVKHTFTLLHHAIDYVNGTRDVLASWKTFEVLAAAPGEACGAKTGQTGCFDDGEIMGNRVLIKHKVDGQTYYTFYNHLKSIESRIPLNDVRDTVHVDAGEVIGQAGDSNSAGELHLHFELLGANMKPIDPYGIYGITDQYPDPRGKNGKLAGKKSYFLTNPPQPFGVTPKPTPTADGSSEPTKTHATPAVASQPAEVASPQPTEGDPSAEPSRSPPSPSPSPLAAAATAPDAVVPPPASGGGGSDLLPLAAAVGGIVIIIVVVVGYVLTRRSRNPLPPDRWRPAR